MSHLPTTGAYILLIRVQSPTSIRIGKLGNLDFKEGWYAYVGSAMGQTATSLYHRLRRHFAPETQKKMHWHVDYLLASPQCRLVNALILPSDKKIECQVVSIVQLVGGQPWGKRFGASDCITCPSHLLFLYSPSEGTFSHQIMYKLKKEIQESGLTREVLITDKKWATSSE